MVARHYDDLLIKNLTKFMPVDQAQEKLNEACRALGLKVKEIDIDAAEKLGRHFISLGGRMSFIGRALIIVLITDKGKKLI